MKCKGQRLVTFGNISHKTSRVDGSCKNLKRKRSNNGKENRYAKTS